MRRLQDVRDAACLGRWPVARRGHVAAPGAAPAPPGPRGCEAACRVPRACARRLTAQGRRHDRGTKRAMEGGGDGGWHQTTVTTRGAASETLVQRRRAVRRPRPPSTFTLAFVPSTECWDRNGCAMARWMAAGKPAFSVAGPGGSRGWRRYGGGMDEVWRRYAWRHVLATRPCFPARRSRDSWPAAPRAPDPSAGIVVYVDYGDHRGLTRQGPGTEYARPCHASGVGRARGALYITYIAAFVAL